MPAIDVTDAPDRLLANKSVTPGHCLEYVSRAIRNGEPPLDWDGLDTALDCWTNGCGDKHDSRNVPRGFPAFLGSKRGSNAGDVIISLGDGTFAATDYPRWGVVGVCTLEQREKQTGRKYLGYAGEFLGYTLTSTSLAGVGTPITESPKPRRHNTMATLYHKTNTTPTLYALAGDSPGTAANWLETTDQGLANGWSAQIGGPSAGLSAATFDSFKTAYLAPLATAGSAAAGASASDVEAAVRTVFADAAAK